MKDRKERKKGRKERKEGKKERKKERCKNSTRFIVPTVVCLKSRELYYFEFNVGLSR